MDQKMDRYDRENKRDQLKREILNMSPSRVLEELRTRNLPLFGTNREKQERLKRACGIQKDPPIHRGNGILKIDEISKRREDRRKKSEEEKSLKCSLRAENTNRNTDVDFLRMIQQFKSQVLPEQPHCISPELKICVCVRKRPLFPSEQSKGEIDAVTSYNPQITVHETKFKVDGITKFLDNHTFCFDSTFGENDDTAKIYESILQPVCPFIVQGGILTCFAYGQTGSGKTFTMKGLQDMVIQDLFRNSNATSFSISFFEIYADKCYDLLNKRAKLPVLEDRTGKINIQGLKEVPVENIQRVLDLIAHGNSNRTTHSTVANQDSSRSHSVCQLKAMNGMLRLVDLAGSERAQDSMSNTNQRQIEGAEINKSLLALKECINALKKGSAKHIPFRASKLTLILRDSFEAGRKVIMITCVSPGHKSSDHTLNSLRYADRLKEQSLVPKPPSIKKIDHEKEARVKSLKAQEATLLERHLDSILQNASFLQEEGKLLESQDLDSISFLVSRKLSLYESLYNALVAHRSAVSSDEEVFKELAGSFAERRNI